MPVFNAAQMKKHMFWQKNQFLGRSVRLCSNLCLLKNNEAVSQDEGSCINNCVQNFATTLGQLEGESKRYYTALDDLVKQGQDKFASRYL